MFSKQAILAKLKTTHWQIFIALVLAFFYGVYLKEYVVYVEWMGRAFMHLIKLIIIPLVMMAIISGVSNLGLTGSLGKVGIRTITFYALTTTFAVLTGLILVNVISPGEGLHFGNNMMSAPSPSKDMIPDNFIKALYDGNMMVIVFSALLFGFFITKIDESSRERLSTVFSAFFDVMMRLTQFIIKLSPYGIFGLMANVIAHQSDLAKVFTNILYYALTVLGALLIHGLITLPLMLKLWGGVKPYRHMKNMSTPLLTAFTTCSSGAALPYTIDAVQNKSKVSKKITNFVIPLGGTMNFDGTALYECIAVIFIAQVGGIDLTFQNQLIIVLMSLMVSFAGAAVPMAGLFMIPVVLHTAFPNNPELSAFGIALIFPVDRFLDMFRTTINVWSDCCAAALVAKREGEELDV